MEVMNNFMNKFRATLAVSLLVASIPVSALKSDSGEQLYYRYLDESGIRVLSQTLPPSYTGVGYELVTATGRVEKTVAAALSPEDARLMKLMREEEKRLAAWDKELKRRYSHSREIGMARDRKLTEVDRNIAILKSNARGIKNKIEGQHAAAADKERMGQTVSEATLRRLELLEGELDGVESQIAERRELYGAITQKFAKDIERFKQIKKQ
jgi:hypothetical protein